MLFQVITQNRHLGQCGLREMKTKLICFMLVLVAQLYACAPAPALTEEQAFSRGALVMCAMEYTMAACQAKVPQAVQFVAQGLGYADSFFRGAHVMCLTEKTEEVCAKKISFLRDGDYENSLVLSTPTP